MMTVLEDLRMALRQICGAIGLSRDAAAVVSLIVLGIALNAVALNAAESMRTRKHSTQGTKMLRRAARTELKVMRTVFVSTLKKIGDGQRGWCFAGQWQTDQEPAGMKHSLGANIIRAALAKNKD